MKDINLDIEDSKFIVLTGPNGGGKTTLAKNIFDKVGNNDAVLISMDSYYKDNKKRRD